MKFFSKLLMLGFFVSLFFACERENATLVEEQLDSKAQVEQYVKQYLARHGQPPRVDYTSLEALNELYIASGLPIVTLEELESTPEQYQAAQDRIKAIANGTAVEIRCDDVIWDILGDINDDNELTQDDIDIARMIILGTSNESPGLFGCISNEAGAGTPGCALTTLDLVIATKVVLGYPCDQI